MSNTLHAQLTLDSIERMLNNQVAGVKLAITAETRTLLKQNIAFLRAGLNSGHVEETIERVNLFSEDVRHMGNIAR